MRKWTIIDTLIVAAVAVVAIVGVKMFSTTASETKTTTVEVVVLADNKEVGFSNAVKIGEEIAISLSEKDGGIVTNVVSEPSKMMALDTANGVYNNAEVPGKDDVYIYI